VPTSFPFAVPPIGKPVPETLLLKDAAEDAAVLRYFLKRHIPSRPIPPESPMWRWLARLDSIGRGNMNASPVFEWSLHPDDPLADDLVVEGFADSMDYLLASRLVWAIRVLEGAGHPRVQFDQTAVADLLKTDLPVGDPRQPAMPAGTETFVLAARLINMSGGSIRICGTGSVGCDLLWSPPTGPSLRIERKDRAFRAAFDSTPNQLWDWLGGQIAGASGGFVNDPAKPRIVVVGAPVEGSLGRELLAGFPEFVRKLKERFDRHEKTKGSPLVQHIPAAVCLHVAGLELDPFRPDEQTHFLELSNSKDAGLLADARPHLRRAFEASEAQEEKPVAEAGPKDGAK
jgi:hypothetical protein